MFNWKFLFIAHPLKGVSIFTITMITTYKELILTNRDDTVFSTEMAWFWSYSSQQLNGSRTAVLGLYLSFFGMWLLAIRNSAPKVIPRPTTEAHMTLLKHTQLGSFLHCFRLFIINDDLGGGKDYGQGWQELYLEENDLWCTRTILFSEGFSSASEKPFKVNSSDYQKIPKWNVSIQKGWGELSWSSGSHPYKKKALEV